MTAAEQAATAPAETSDAPLPVRQHLLWLACLGRWWHGATSRRRDHRALRHLSRRTLRDLGLEPEDLGDL